MVVSNEVKFLILTILDNDGDIDDLYKLGYDYVEIKKIIKNEIEIGNAQFDNNELKLTKKGAELRKELSNSLNYGKNKELVVPKYSSKIETLALNQLFIPSENELDF